MNRPLIVKPNVVPHPPNGLVAVDRAIAELRRGAVVFVGDGAGALVIATEAASARKLKALGELTGSPPCVVATSRRAGALGMVVDSTRPVTLITVEHGLTPEDVRRLVDPFGGTIGARTDGGADGGIDRATFRADSAEPPAWAHAAVTLAKLARLLPAVVAADCAAPPDDEGLYRVSAADILAYPVRAARELRRVAEARVPLADAEDCRVVAFRPSDGGIEHLAIIVGQPNRDQPVLTRLHSECFTGDLLGSLRCDCGDQLRGALASLAREGSGVLLYLAQEGRGIGLINKLHAYSLQDAGLDTLDANHQLGFDDDERIYQPAAEMLKLLGIERVRLLTNNPAKVEGLTRHGIPVTERVPHVIPANGHNESYLRTKAKRSGHFL